MLTLKIDGKYSKIQVQMTLKWKILSNRIIEFSFKTGSMVSGSQN
jgi:hypothetical protein